MGAKKNARLIVMGFNLIFKVKGDARTGLGHIIRSLQIANHLKKEADISFYPNAFGPNEKIIEASGHAFVPSGHDPVARMAKDFRGHVVDAVIIDQPEQDLNLGKLKKAFPEAILIALDCFDYSPLLDGVINLWNRNRVIKDPSQMVGHYYEGLQYAIIREEFRKYAKLRRDIGEQVKRAVVTFGSADSSENTVKALDILLLTKTDMRIDVIIGPAFSGTRKILQKAKSFRQCNVIETPENIEKFIFESDIGFCGAGMTMMEFCCLGTPPIIIPQNAQENEFAAIFERRDAAIVLNSDDKSYCAERLNELTYGTRRSISAQGKALIDCDGVERVKKIIIEALTTWR